VSRPLCSRTSPGSCVQAPDARAPLAHICRGLALGALILLLVEPAAAARERTLTSPRPSITRLVFAATVSHFHTQIFSVTPSGQAAAQLTFSTQGASDPVPSPDGTRIAFERGGDLWVMHADGRGQRLLAKQATEPAWTRDSGRLAYVSLDAQDLSLGIGTVRRDGSGRRMLVHGDAFRPAWSPDSRNLAFGRSGVLVILRSGRQRTVLTDSRIGRAARIAWSSDGRWIAFGDFVAVDVVRRDGRGRRELTGGLPAWAPHHVLLAFSSGGPQNAVSVLNPSTGVQRKIASAAFVNSLAWSPSGDALAVSAGFLSSEELSSRDDALLIAPLHGRARNLARPSDPYAVPEGVSWTRSPARLRLRAPLPVTPRVSPTELRLREPVEDLAADGNRVAYRFCGTIAVWRPGARTVVSVQADHPLCGEANLGFYNLALAGDRVAWASLEGGNVQYNSLVVEPLGDPAARAGVAFGFHTTGDFRGDERAGDLLGAGSLLVFSTWAYCDSIPPFCTDVPYGHGPLVSQTLWRVREPSWPGECPGASISGGRAVGRCQQLRVEPGPLRPLDADAGRIVVSGDNATLVLDSDGHPLLRLPLSTQAAELTGSDLAVLVPGELRDYEVATGALLHSWPVPAVSSGGFCGVPARFCGAPRLRVEDAAHGMVAYIADGQIHLLRLSDGRDVTLHAGTAAEFGDDGLFYAYQAGGYWPGRISFVPFGRLPLH
jgi:WD40-like Beta Propeller Repeat